jgi:hypothetical protein
VGWADCGTDSRGRHIGYAYPARCDQPKCHVRIDRGLSYACGDMHGEVDEGCEGYFCEKHRQNAVKVDDRTVYVCDVCEQSLLESREWIEDPDEGLVRIATGGGVA